MNFELIAKEVSKETFILTGEITNTEIINNLTKFVKEKKDEKLSFKTHVKGKFTGFKSLINNRDFINFLKIIRPNIKVVYPENFIIEDAWGNLCKINEEVTEHEHAGVSAFCGILYLSEGGPGTYFKDYDLLIKEKIGKYILFSPSLLHRVEKIKNNIERITIAFNMGQIQKWVDYSDATWIRENEI